MKKKVWHRSYLLVDEVYRNTGVGSQILQNLLKEAEEKRALVVLEADAPLLGRR
jgi:GNAT superfamily N-acetyltransferase